MSVAMRSAPPPVGVAVGTVRGAVRRLWWARWVSWLVVVAGGAAALAGLSADGLYRDPPVVAAVFRGTDLAALLVGLPLLAAALIGPARRSVRLRLLWLGMLAYSVYNYAYYVFGARFNVLFLVHVLLLVASGTALALVASTIENDQIDPRVRSRRRVRWVAALLLLLAVVLVGFYSQAVLRFAVTGQLPGDVLPLPADRTHLGYALDLGVLVPGLVFAAVQMWRRTTAGYFGGVAMCLAVGAYQITYIVQRVFVADAGTPGVAAFNPADLILPAALAVAAVSLLAGRVVAHPPPDAELSDYAGS